MTEMQRVEIVSEEKIHVYGRHVKTETTLLLPYTGSGIEFSMKCSQVWLETVVREHYLAPWISVAMDGAVICRMRLLEGRNRICILDGVSCETAKKICILKETPARFQEQECVLEIAALWLDGELLPRQEKLRRIEFIGDSITSGEGLAGAKKDPEWSPVIYSADSQRHYASHLASVLEADFRIVSQSGWGVLSSYRNNPTETLPAVYDKICGIFQTERSCEVGFLKAYEFENWQPHLVVVGLGTNDEAAFYNPEWEEAGKHFKQRMNEDGSFWAEDTQRFSAAVTGFLHQIRSKNPSAWILWVYGMIKNTMAPWISEGIFVYQKESGDKKISYLELPDTAEDEIGSAGHPGAASHLRAAKLILEHCKKLEII